MKTTQREDRGKRTENNPKEIYRYLRLILTFAALPIRLPGPCARRRGSKCGKAPSENKRAEPSRDTAPGRRPAGKRGPALPGWKGPAPGAAASGSAGAARAGPGGAVDWDVDWDVDWEADGAARSHARCWGPHCKRSGEAFPRAGVGGCEPVV